MCLIPLIASICIADPANLSLQAGASTQIAGPFKYFVDYRDYGGGLLGHAKIDMAVPATKRVTFHYGVEHTSLLDTRSDHGQARVYLAISWSPFK